MELPAEQPAARLELLHRVRSGLVVQAARALRVHRLCGQRQLPLHVRQCRLQVRRPRCRMRRLPMHRLRARAR